ncbi:MAG: hypothetical protein LBU79_09255 [Planctomycetota bacterium]|jgi:hypothetical protein|nr:hypothetical protein [Planctomycetota bacterium]
MSKFGPTLRASRFFASCLATLFLLAGWALAADSPDNALTTIGWGAILVEFLRSIDTVCFVGLVIFVMLVGLAVDVFYHIRISRLIPDEVLTGVQEEMINGEYEKALETCQKSDSLVAQVFATALAKTDYSFERMETAFREEAAVVGLIWRQWVDQFRLFAWVGGLVGLAGALLDSISLLANTAGRANASFVSVSSFEIRATIYCILGSLVIGVANMILALVVHHFAQASLTRILVEVDRLGGELLDPFRPIPETTEENS